MTFTTENTAGYSAAALGAMNRLAAEAFDRWAASEDYDESVAADYRQHVAERVGTRAADCLHLTGEVTEAALRSALRALGDVD